MESLQTDGTQFSRGKKLHHEVQPECWCVTRGDLKSLKLDICRALEKAELKPSDGDRFDPDDREVGPNMYTVVQQYLKPVTASHGGMSWALMKHPAGLKCDIFVTHAWSEGVFELIDKVLTSWPSGKRHAYICALANPQNLDIGGLISSPQDSPFAKALHSCSHILVVPNHKVSIYSRLWCVYEAFLGYSLDKVILVSRRPWNRKLIHMMLELVPAMLIGFLLGCVVQDPNQRGFAFATYVFSTCTILLDANQVKRIMTHIALCGLSYMGTMRCPFCSGWYKYQLWPTIIQCYGFYSILIFSLLVGAIDSYAGEEADYESNELTHEFSGDARDAQCSNISDRNSILVEIGNRIEDVNHTIKVLLDAGMSTSELRFLASQGLRIRHAGYINLSLTSAGILTWIRLATVWHYIHCDLQGRPQMSKRQVFMMVSCVGWIILWLSSAQDRRAFASACVARIFYLSDFLQYVVGTCMYGSVAFTSWESSNEGAHGLVVATAGTITCVLSVVGPANLIRIPFVGRLIVRYVMTKRFFKCCTSLFGRGKEMRSSRAVELMEFDRGPRLNPPAESSVSKQSSEWTPNEELFFPTCSVSSEK